MNTTGKSDYFPFKLYARFQGFIELLSRNVDSLFLEVQFPSAWWGWEHSAKDIFLARSASQIHALNKVVADPESDSEDDFYGEWCDEDGNFNLHGGDVGCVHDSQSLLLQSDDLWLDQVAFNNWLKMFTVSVKNTWLGILLYIYLMKNKRARGHLLHQS